jgi:tetratricopeptide (TPR) repeat protein
MQGFLMIRRLHFFAFISAAILSLLSGLAPTAAQAQSSSSSYSNQSSSSGQMYVREKAPSLIDPAGPTVSLISSEPVFIMAAALNVCGYDEGLEESAPIRKHVRDEINQALAQSEDARTKRDALCLYSAQHRMTGSVRDISQYISLALYLTPPPELEVTADLTEMPPDSTQVVEILPALRAFAAAVDLHGIWLGSHHAYDEEIDKLHDPISQMIVKANLYLKMPASTYDGRRFIVVIEPLLSPAMVNARIYGTDYVVVVSPVDGKIPMADVRHTYLHYVIDPLLYQRSSAIDREQPILKEIRDAPLDFRFRSDTVSLTIECLIKAIEARTMDTGIPEYIIPANVDRSQLPIYEHQRELYQQKVDGAKLAAVAHDMRQGYVLTQYFYEQLLSFEKDPASLKDTMGEMVYGMDVDQQVHRARQTEFDKVGDEDVLQQSKPRPLIGLDLAEAKLAGGDVAAATTLAQKALVEQSDTVQSTADAARAHFILARVDLLTGHPDQAIDDFQRTLATSKEQRLLAWSHIYLGRMLDLECKRDEALAEYKEALAVRDGQVDTRVAAERGVKAAYVQRGHEHDCDDDTNEDAPNTSPQQTAPGAPPVAGGSGGAGSTKPESQARDGVPKPQ